MEEVSLLDRMKPYQYLYDIISYRIEEELNKKQNQMARQPTITDYDQYSEAPLTNYHTYNTMYNPTTGNLQYANPSVDNGRNTPSNMVMNYGTPGQVDNGTYELNFKKEWFNSLESDNKELRKKLEENLPDECFIRDEDGNLKKVTKAEAIQFELKESIKEADQILIHKGNGLESQINQYNQITKEQLEEWYKHTMLQGHTHNSDTSRDYVLHTGSAGRDMFYQALEGSSNNWNNAANWSVPTPENHL